MIDMKLIKELRFKTKAGMLDCKKALEINNGDIKKSIIWLNKKGIYEVIKKCNLNNPIEGIIGLISKYNKIVIYEVNSETDFIIKNKQFLNLFNIIGKVLINNEPKNLEEALKIFINGETLENIIYKNIAIIGEKIILSRFKIINLKLNQSAGLYLHYNNQIASILVFDGKINKIIGKQLAMHVSAMRPKFISKSYIPIDFLNKEKSILISKIKNNYKNFNKSDFFLEKIVKKQLDKKISKILFLDQFFIINNKKISDIIKENNVNVICMIYYKVGEKNK